MKLFKILVPSLLLTLTTAVYADSLCSKLPGNWQGIYTIKNPDVCATFNGCTHLVRAQATFVSGNTYNIKISPAVGNGGDFNVTCENGVITSPVNPGNTVTATCNKSNECFVVYEDALLTSEMSKG